MVLVCYTLIKQGAIFFCLEKTRDCICRLDTVVFILADFFSGCVCCVGFATLNVYLTSKESVGQPAAKAAFLGDVWNTGVPFPHLAQTSLSYCFGFKRFSEMTAAV